MAFFYYDDGFFTAGAYSYGGTIFDDWLVGTRFGDRISGRDGDDLIEGLGGDDTLAGNDGRDEVYGDEGWDTVTGGDGRDYLDGGPGADVVGGGQGTDTLLGGTGDDLLGGDGNADFLYGEAGNDTLDGGAGDDSLWGDGGDDRLLGAEGFDTAFYNIDFDEVIVRRDDPNAVVFFINDGSTDRLEFIERAEFRDGTLEIGPATENEGFVYRLYDAVFDRPADAGLDFWVDEMSEGATEETVAQAFLDSPEYADVYGGASDEALIDLLYENVLGREADETGKDYWLEQLEGSLEQDDLLLIFTESAENIATHEQLLEAGLFYGA